MTEYVKTVDPNGGADYSSLNLWEDGEDDLYQSGDVAIADCRRNGSAKDTTAVNVNGWTTGVEARVVVNPAYRHEGKWADQRSDGKYAYVIESSSTHPVYCTSNDVNLFGLLVRNDGGGYSNSVQLVGQRCTLNESIVQVTAKSARHRGVYVNSANGGVRNVIVYSLHASPSEWAYQKNGGVGWAYNCGAYNMGFGFGRGGAIDWDVTNCWALKCNDPYTDTSGAYIHGDHNVSSGSYAPGTTVAVNKTSYTDYFVDPANGDFHLKAPAQQLWGISGQNLSALFTTDIDGQTRTAWDIGADEYVTATPTQYVLEAGGASYALSGAAVTLRASRKLAAGSAAFALTGQSAALKLGRRLAADGGSYQLMGADVALLYDRILHADGATLTLTGQSVSLLYGRRLAAEPGTLTLTGQDRDLLYGRRLYAEAGSLILTGAEATLVYTPAGAYVLQADGALLALSGSDAALLYSRKLEASGGQISITGRDVSLRAARRVNAGSGALLLTGHYASLIYTPAGTYTLSAEAGIVRLTGGDAALLSNRRLPVEAGSYEVSGSPVSLLHGRAILAEPGSMVISGQADLRATRRLTAEAAALMIDGKDAGLHRGYVVLADPAMLELSGGDSEFLRTYVVAAEDGQLLLLGGDVYLRWSGLILPRTLRVMSVTMRKPTVRARMRKATATARRLE